MRVNLPVRFAKTNVRLTRGFIRDPKDQVLRAVAGATSLYDPEKAMETAELAVEEPEKVIAPDLDDELLIPVLKAVTDAQAKPGEAPKPSKAQAAIAKALGVPKELVTSAFAAIIEPGARADRDSRAKESREWVAAVNAKLLRTAANTGARASQLERVPTRATRLGRIEREIRSLDERVTALEEAG